MNARDELARALYAARRPGETWEYMTDRQKASYLRSADRLASSLESIGYRKPRTITTRAEVEALEDGSVVADSAGDVSEKRGGLWCSYEAAPMTDARLSKYLPATVLHEAVK